MLKISPRQINTSGQRPGSGGPIKVFPGKEQLTQHLGGSHFADNRSTENLSKDHLNGGKSHTSFIHVPTSGNLSKAPKIPSPVLKHGIKRTTNPMHDR